MSLSRFPSSRSRLLQSRLLQSLATALMLAAAAACSDLDRLLDYAFPPTVPGLPGEGPWVALPIGGWVTEGGIEARAIAACFSPACPERAAVGLFRAEGREAVLLSEIVADPEQLKRGLAESGRRRRSPKRQHPRTEVAVSPLREGALAGFALRLARPDGSHAAHGIVLARREQRSTSFLVVIGETEEAARRIAFAVAARLA